MHNSKLACRVCGMLQLDPPWGIDGLTPNYEICSCCGVEFGYEDSTIKSVKSYRKRWLDEGAIWTDSSERPDIWNIEEQLENVPDEFK